MVSACSYEQSEVKIRNSLKYVGYKDRKQIAAELKAIYSADTLDLAKTALDDFKEKHQSDFPNIAKSWENNWDELTAYFRYPKAIRKLIYSTNSIESPSSVIKRKTKSKSVFLILDSALKAMYLYILEILEKWKSSKIRDWSEIYPQLSIYFSDTLEKYEQNFIYGFKNIRWIYTVCLTEPAKRVNLAPAYYLLKTIFTQPNLPLFIYLNLSCIF